VSRYAGACYEASTYSLFLCLKWTCYFDCVGVAVFVVPALGNGPVFILVIFVMLSTHGLSMG
jgi:hypothetical protein